MKKTLKLSLTLVLAFVMLFAVAVVASAETEPTASGECGANGGELIWEYYEDTNTLVISGNGRMMSYESTALAPWHKYRSTMQALVLEEGITSIGKSAFTNCTSLTEVVIPDSVETINPYAFMGCSGLKKLHIGTGLENVYKYAFQGCSNVEYLSAGSLASWCQIEFAEGAGNPLSRISTAANRVLYVDGVAITDLVIPEEVEKIGNYTFYNSTIKSVVFTDNVKTIGRGAFQNCNYLETMTFNNCSVSTGTQTFGTLNRLTTVNVNNVATWVKNSFTTTGNPMRTTTGRATRFAIIIDGKKLVREVNSTNKAPESVTVVFPENTTVMNKDVFYARKNLKEVYIPASVTSINGESDGARNKGAFNAASVTTIYGEAGSYAETFAANNRYSFVAITPVAVSGISLNKAAETVEIGSSLTLAATVTPADATYNQVIWTSSDSDVAYVSNGVVKAIAAGEATITASTSNGAYTATCVITVPGIAVEGIELDQTEVELTMGHTVKLVPTFTPANASNKNIVWTSENNAIAKVVDGVVTPVSGGTVTITATTEDGSFTATCEVTVVVPTINVTGVAIDVTGATLKVEETLQLNATVTPADATNADVVWTSADDTIATVVDGLVTAVSEGTVVITVTTVDGSFTATSTIIVEPNEVIPEDVPVEEIALDVEELAIVFGETYQFEVIFTPEDTTERNLFWESTNEDVATIDENGLLTAIAPGITIITVLSEDNEDLYAECVVEVTAGTPVEGISLNKTTANVYLGDIVNLEVIFNPADATNKNVTWESSNDAVVTVDNGVVTAVAGGVATVTATSEDGSFTATCKFIVAVGNETPPIEWN